MIGVDSVDSRRRMKARKKMMESGVAGRSIIATHTPPSALAAVVCISNECGWVSLIAILRSSREVTLADGTASQDERGGQEAGSEDGRAAMWSHVDVLMDGLFEMYSEWCMTGSVDADTVARGGWWCCTPKAGPSPRVVWRGREGEITRLWLARYAMHAENKPASRTEMKRRINGEHTRLVPAKRCEKFHDVVVLGNSEGATSMFQKATRRTRLA